MNKKPEHTRRTVPILDGLAVRLPILISLRTLVKNKHSLACEISSVKRGGYGNMARRSYGQHCGIARALELVGERWTLLIVRDLLLHPRRYTELHRGLPGIPTNVLSSRLRDLEQHGILRRRVLPRPASSTVYELTPYGRDLEDILLRLGRWGACSLPEPGAGETGYIDPSIRALRATFRPDVAGELAASFEIRFGDFVIHAVVVEGTLEVGEGPLPSPDLSIDVGTSLTPLLTGHVEAAPAIESGRIRVDGDEALLERFIAIFAMPPDWYADRPAEAEEEQT